MHGHAFRRFGGDRIAVLSGEESATAARCFADDVVIDFPSMAHAVDRMRAPFVADERSTPLLMRVEISAREAREGVVMSLDVPFRRICRPCGGRGEVWTGCCASCVGSGSELFQHQLEVTLPAGVADGDTFHFTVAPRHHPSTRIELHVFLG